MTADPTVKLVQHLRREHGWGIRRLSKEFGEPERVIRHWLGEAS